MRKPILVAVGLLLTVSVSLPASTQNYTKKECKIINGEEVCEEDKKHMDHEGGSFFNDAGSRMQPPPVDGVNDAPAYYKRMQRPPLEVQSDGGDPGPLKASGIFVAPHDYPPYEYAAYGIVAFPTAKTTGTKWRFIRVCEAYVATLPPASTLSVPLDQQMVTVWPVDTQALAQKLSNAKTPDERIEGCEDAVDHYHMNTALIALREALKGQRIEGNGPFLLAWSPASTKGKADALVLVADLSNLNSDEEFLDRFQKWRDDIESNPDLFKDHWTVDRVRSAIKDWADHWGNIFLSSGEASEQ